MDMRSIAVPPDPPAGCRSPLEPGCSVGSYLILERLSTSRHAEVFLAHDLALERMVVLKTTAPGASTAAALRYEARLLARARNACLVTLYALDESGPAPVLVLEHLVGETLAQRLARRGPLAVPAAAELFGKLVAGLERLHRAGIVHGAVRPDNIFLPTDGGPRFLGLQRARQSERAPGATPAGAGDLLYGAPEARTALTAAPADDLYSLALCLHETLSGALPFEKRGLAGVRRRALPPALARFLARATSPDPHARFASAAAFHAALMDAALPASTARTPRARRWRAWTLDLALIGALAALVFALELHPFGERSAPTAQALSAPDGDSPATPRRTQGPAPTDKYEALRRAWGG